MAVQIPIQAVHDAQEADFGLRDILLAIAGPESGWDSQAKGDCKLAWGGIIVPCITPGSFPTSFSYTQLHIDGGLGDGIPPERLLNGVYNFQLAARHIRGEIASGKSLYDALWPWSARPAIWALYERIQAEGIEGVSTGNGREPPPLPVSHNALVPILGLLAIWIVVS